MRTTPTKKRTTFSVYREHYAQTLVLAAPVMLSQVGVAVVQLADNIMVGRLGALSLAAVSFAGSVYFIAFILLTGLTVGLTPLVGMHHGSGEKQAAVGCFQNALALYPTVGLVVSALLELSTPLLFQLGQPQEVVQTAIPYYRFLVWSTAPYMFFCGCRQFMEGLGVTKWNLVIVAVANIFNVVGNWVFIYGKLGFAPMEVSGAGLATFLSRLLMAAMAWGAVCLLPQMKAYVADFKRSYFSFATVRRLVRMGVPIALQMCMEGAAFALSGIMMGWFGTIELAGNQIATVVSNFAFMVLTGLGTAVTIKVSHAYGRGDVLGVRRSAAAAVHLSLVWNVLTVILLLSFRETIAALFTTDAQAAQVAAGLMIYVAAFQVSDGLQTTLVGVLRGLQDVRTVMWIAFVAYLLVNLPIGYFLGFVCGMGPGGLWIGFIFGLSLAAILLGIRYRTRHLAARR